MLKLCLLTFTLLSLVSRAAQKPNVLFLCIDDLRPELHCYGVDYIKSPNIDTLAKSGRLFTNHFVQAPTCGASRYALLTGSYGPADNGALFSAAKVADTKPLTTLPGYFRQQGYTSVSVGKVSHHPGGRGGPDWDDEAIPEMPDAWDRHLMPTGAWQHPRGAMHGLANGEIRKRRKSMDVFQSAEGDDSIYPDGLITQTALQQLDALGGAAKDGNKPFFLAIGWLKPHLPFGAPAKYMEPYKEIKLPPIPHPQAPKGTTTWHRSNEYMGYNGWGKNPNLNPKFAEEVRKHYAACVSYSDAQVGIVMKKLDDLGLRDNTIVVVWGDHGWHLGEHFIWGKHSLFEESLRSPLIIHSPGISKPGIQSDAIVETIDIFPTLCDLAGLEQPSQIDGTSLRPILDDPKSSGDVAISYKDPNQQTIRTPEYRLIRHQGKNKETIATELYRHQPSDGETVNLADEHSEIVKQLERLLDQKLKQ